MNKKQKSLNNKGFSLVELIIVIAIMAVLVGVLAPTYMQYVEKSKKSNDVSSVDSILSACEVAAVDPEASDLTTNLTIKLTTGTTTWTPATTGTDTKYIAAVKKIVGDNVSLKSTKWGDIEIVVANGGDGKVTFTITNTDTTVKFKDYATELGKRTGVTIN